jgi:hypothetical protein
MIVTRDGFFFGEKVSPESSNVDRSTLPITNSNIFQKIESLVAIDSRSAVVRFFIEKKKSRSDARFELNKIWGLGITYACKRHAAQTYPRSDDHFE